MHRHLLLGFAFTVMACQQDFQPPPFDEDFDIPRTEPFAESLLDYELFEQPLAALQPAEGVHVYELSSELFTDYAYKQRLIRVPGGTTATTGADGRLRYPEGTIMVKTFYYPEDMRVADGPRRVIETRLLVKTDGVWNVATYLWNDEQTDATLLLDGTTAEVSWTDETGRSRSTTYAVPHEGECVTCHQSGGDAAYIGPTVLNLNRPVTRDNGEENQLDHLGAKGVLAEFESAPTIPNYKDSSESLERRARAYLAINCAHCHNPQAWDASTDRGYDFRYDTPLADTGLETEPRRFERVVESGEMPYLGTTMLHDDGVELMLEYVRSL